MPMAMHPVTGREANTGLLRTAADDASSDASWVGWKRPCTVAQWLARDMLVHIVLLLLRYYDSLRRPTCLRRTFGRRFRFALGAFLE